MMYNSTKTRSQQVRQIVEEHYEEGSQSTCKLAIYRKYIRRQYGISQRTFFQYLNNSKMLESVPQRPMAVQLEFQFA